MLAGRPTIPVVLLGHVDPSSLADRMLDASLFVAMSYGLALVGRRLLTEACNRGNEDGGLRYQTVRHAAMSVGGPEAIAAIEKAIVWCEAAGDSPGLLQVDRFVLALGADDTATAQDAFEQASKYTDQPEVASRLGGILQQLDRLQQQLTGQSPTAQAPAAAAGSGLWTPDGAVPAPDAPSPTQPAAEASKSKLWLPGQQ